MSKKEQILKLRSEGKSYKEIKEIVKCSKSTISYYCNKTQIEKSSLRQKTNRKNNVLARKIESFRYKVKDFQRKKTNGRFENGIRDNSFGVKEVLEKFGENPTCYLTGRSIDLKDTKTYNFDHIVPSSKGGRGDIDNLGLTCKEGNIAKSDLILDDFLNLCKEILNHHGYIITKSNYSTLD